MIETLDQIIEDGYNRKLVHNYTSLEHPEKKSSIQINDHHEMINFGSCSYLNLENDPRLKEAVIDAVNKYGTQFSSSRTYLSIGLYNILERKLGEIFDQPLIVTASTTLGHLATIPVIVGENDAVILDLQVHSSIQMTVQQLKAKKIPVHMVQHNCMDSLESKIKALNNKHDKIWYFADGVYSMYGDYAPFEQLTSLLDKYNKLHLYIDDAHGMGWTGKNGIGVVRKYMNHHERMVLAVSLNKSFASAGGCIVFPNTEMERLVRNCGSTYIFSGPIQPPMLGAAIASADLHLSAEINEKQFELFELISLTNQLLDDHGFPQFQRTESPLFFIPVGLPKLCYDIIGKMKHRGFFLNTASFPAVPMKRSGIRFMVNSSLSKIEIQEMISNLAEVYEEVVHKYDNSYENIAKKFRIENFCIKSNKSSPKRQKLEPNLIVTESNSISELNEKEWNTNFENQGNLSFQHIKNIETVFSNNEISAFNWNFKYISIEDEKGTLLIQTFFTVSTTKDDMFSKGYVSEKIEEDRKKLGANFLTTKTLMIGSQATKGNHIFIDKSNPLWESALSKLLNIVNQYAEENKVGKILLRDFYNHEESEIESFMLEHGFIKFQLPNNMVIDQLEWKSQDEYLSKLGQKYRYNVRKEILQYSDQFEIEFGLEHNELGKAFQLYQNVHERSFDLNVHQLPYEYFQSMINNENYDVIKLYLTPSGLDKTLVGVMFSQITRTNYNAMIVGLDYDHVYSSNVYKQILYQTLLRARFMKKSKLDLAFTAEMEKKKIGAFAENVTGFIQMADHFNHAILENYS